MAKVVSGNTLQLDNGQSVQAQNGGWYDGQQFFNGNLGSAGTIINPNQQGAGQQVSSDVVAQTNPNNVAFLQSKGANPQPANNPNPAPQAGPTGGTTGGSNPSVSSLFGNNGSSSIVNPQTLYNSLTPNTPDLQKKADAIQAQIDQLTQDQGGAISNNNENPFLSNGNRQGREQAITTDFQNRIDALTNKRNSILGEINTEQTNAQNQVNLALQNYSINDQQHQEALGQFNTLMSSGLLGNLSSGDVASIAQSTGLPTNVIQEAMTKSQQANVNVQMVTTDHGVTLIDANTGNIIKDVTIPGVTGGSGLTATQQKQADAEANKQSLIGDIQAGHTLQELVNTYAVDGSGLTKEQIYNWYNEYSPRGKAKETLKQINAGQFANLPNFQQDPTAPGYVKPASSGFFGL